MITGLSTRQLELILEALSEKYGMGYASDPEVARLQALLSVQLQFQGSRDEKGSKAV